MVLDGFGLRALEQLKLSAVLCAENFLCRFGVVGFNNISHRVGDADGISKTDLKGD